MIWGIRTIEAALGFRSRIVLGLGSGGSLDGPAMADRLFEGLQQDAEEWAISLHRDDIVVEEIIHRGGPMEGTTEYLARWAPTNRPAEIMGGTHDGTLIMVPADDGEVIPRPLVLDRPPESFYSALRTDTDTGKHTVIPITQTWHRVTGWSDLHRQWIYTPEGNR